MKAYSHLALDERENVKIPDSSKKKTFRETICDEVVSAVQNLAALYASMPSQEETDDDDYRELVTELCMSYATAEAWYAHMLGDIRLLLRVIMVEEGQQW